MSPAEQSMAGSKLVAYGRAAGRLKVETIADEAALDAIAGEWARLDESVTPRLPFSSPSWSRLWWKHFRRDSLSVRDDLRVFVLRDRDRALVGVAPMMLTQRPAVGPLRSRELQFL